MTQVSVEDLIAARLTRLPAHLRKRVLAFADALVQSQDAGTPGAEVAAFADTISLDDLQAMSGAIDADCERIDTRGW